RASAAPSPGCGTAAGARRVARRGPKRIHQRLTELHHCPDLVRRRLSEAHDDEIELRDDQHALAPRALAGEDAEAAGRHPEVCAVEAVRLAARRAAVVDPAFGQDAPAVPDAVAQVEQAEARQVAGAARAVARADEVARRV